MTTSTTLPAVLLLPLLLFNLASVPVMVQAISCAGCVDLDEINFDKTIQRFPYALVKFDIAFPYGEKHEAFALFSKAAHKVTDELLVATVGIKDYGELENKALGERFQIDDKNYPGIILFKGSVTNYERLPAHLDVTLDNLKSFVTQHSTLYIGRDGCLKEFNQALKNYANLDDREQLKLLTELKLVKEGLEKKAEQQSATVYLAYMRKINEQGYDFVEQEKKRLQRLKAGKITDAKKVELQEKLNILETFVVNKLIKNQEEQTKKKEL